MTKTTPIRRGRATRGTRTRRLASPLLAALLLAACSTSPGPGERPSSLPEELETRMFEATVAVRLERGRPALARDPILDEAARRHSRRMATGQVTLGHDGVRRRFERLRSQLPLAGLAENVASARGHRDPVPVIVDGWLDSRSHRRNLLGGFDRAGLGAAISPDGTIYVTQILAASKVP